MKVFIFDPLWDKLITDELVLKLRQANVELIITKEVSPIRSLAELYTGNEERILCVNPDFVNWNLSSEDYSEIPNLKGIFPASTGYEWINSDAADKQEIPICNIRHFNNESVAEWAILMAISLARNVPLLIKDGFPLDYDKDFMKYRGIELKGKTAGIIGMGHIGTAIAERAKGLGMSVKYWSKASINDNFKKVELSNIFSSSDLIFPAVAKNDETIALFNDEQIESMKPTAILVDVIHGILNHSLLLKKVENGSLYGYGFEGKPKEFENHKGNVWAAPEYAWATESSMNNCMVKWVDNMILASEGKFPNKVN